MNSQENQEIPSVPPALSRDSSSPPTSIERTTANEIDARLPTDECVCVVSGNNEVSYKDFEIDLDINSTQLQFFCSLFDLVKVSVSFVKIDFHAVLVLNYGYEQLSFSLYGYFDNYEPPKFSFVQYTFK